MNAQAAIASTRSFSPVKTSTLPPQTRQKPRERLKPSETGIEHLSAKPWACRSRTEALNGRKGIVRGGPTDDGRWQAATWVLSGLVHVGFRAFVGWCMLSQMLLFNTEFSYVDFHSHLACIRIVQHWLRIVSVKATWSKVEFWNDSGSAVDVLLDICADRKLPPLPHTSNPTLENTESQTRNFALHHDTPKPPSPQPPKPESCEAELVNLKSEVCKKP